ncbi:hypothetical protein OBBRIDRAFT_787411 [Obba rivulosa]|uniref:Smr domain-containing protein n=1 Tax=Obba rivulosa TaxID=1052685 RepID=A0A8E2DUZ0_9APHY|nr:hypothetical protein OBBRIDRAFT_787411 [Obba rivulosa]
MGSLASLHDTFQAEFSPPLDSSLIALIVDDFLSTNGHTQEALRLLREQLSELAAAAETQLHDEDVLTEKASQLKISSHSASITDDSYFPDCLSGDNAASSTSTSITSDASSQQSATSPLAFLRSVFPCVPVGKLRKALSHVYLGDVDDMDMENIIDNVLSGEYIRELEERGLDGLDGDAAGGSLDDIAPWETVQTKKKPQQLSLTQTKAKKSSNNRGTKIALIDVRQRQHIRSAPTSPRAPAAPDPWTQLSSVASFLSTLLPMQPPSYFQSIFHAPNHPTPMHAVRAALRSIASTSNVPVDSDPTPEEAPQLISLCEILFSQPEHTDLDSEARSQLVDDAKLALRAAHGEPDAVLDIVGLLRELETQEWSVYHSPVPPPSSPAMSLSTSPVSPATPFRVLRLPMHPPPAFRTPPPSPVIHSAGSTSAWQTIPVRSPPPSAHPLAEFIPAYAAVHTRRTRGAGNGLGKGGKGDVGELSATAARHRRRAQQFLDRRREALKEAGRAWQQARNQKHGGDVALYYAERAREFQQQAQKESLEGARAMVQATRSASGNGDTIDLHGTTVAEAVQIVQDLLRAQAASQVRPLKIITGRGTHSANGVGVLGPAVKNALVQDGWLVGTWDAGLVVRGKAS